MARFGKLPIDIPEGVNVEIAGSEIKISGPKGTLVRNLPEGISLKRQDKILLVEAKNESKLMKSLRGTTRSHLVNIIKGVTEGWQKELELVGAGYRAEVKEADLVLTVGFSHPITIKAPEAVKFSVEKNFIKVEGPDKETVTQVAAKIREVRKPEPYKGKGIRYKDEVVRKKPGKAAAKIERGA